MHIAFLTPEYPHSLTGPSGGLGTSIRNLAEALVRKEVKISLIIYSQKEDREFEENGIDFYFLKHRKYSIGGWYFYRKYIQTFLNRLIKQKEIDLIEATDWTGITAFMNLKCPLIIRLNGSDAYFCELEGRSQKFKNRVFEKSALKNANAVASVSQFTADKTNEIFGLDRKYEIIPNSIELENFSSTTNKEKPNRILYFGTIIRKKGVLELAGIFNKVVDRNAEATLILVGKDVKDIFENRSTVDLFKESLSSKAKEKVLYTGPVEYEKIKENIEQASVIVLPSFAEALPMTWIEAMALKKALVTSDIGWAKEVMVNGETGFIASPKQHELYANKILMLLDDSDLRIEMGLNARKRVENKFSSEVVVKQNMIFYKKMINS